MESLIQTHYGPPVVFIHIIDTFTFCFCLLSWIIFYLPEVNFFMTTAHFSLFLHGHGTCVCLFSKFDWNLSNQFTCAQFICTFVCWIFYSTSIRTTECCLETMWKIQIYQKSITHVLVFWKRKKKLAEISSPSILHHISWYHDARIHTKLCNKKQNPKKWWWCHENWCMLIFVKLTLSNQFS